MKVFLRRPSDELLYALIDKNNRSAMSQSEVGITRNWAVEMFDEVPSRKYVGRDLHLYSRFPIGNGREDFAKATTVIEAGVCFDLGWVCCVQEKPFESGDTFSLLAQAFGIWTASFCRVIYKTKEDDDERSIVSLGFGTLPQHAAKGEERLSVVFDRSSGDVHLLIGSYSRPQSWLSKVFYFYFRFQQSKFAAQAAARVRRELPSTK